MLKTIIATIFLLTLVEADIEIHNTRYSICYHQSHSCFNVHKASFEESDSITHDCNKTIEIKFQVKSPFNGSLVDSSAWLWEHGLLTTTKPEEKDCRRTKL